MKWESINLDFVIALPRVRCGFDSILVVVDCLTKAAHFILVKSTTIAIDIANVFVREIFTIQDMPKILISDRDVKFTSNFWRGFFEELGISLTVSIAYLSKIDG